MLEYHQYSLKPYSAALRRDSEDVFRLTAGSRLPEARRFEKWLFEEALPQIRKTGSYGKTDKRLEMTEAQISSALIPVILENQELREENRRLNSRCRCTPDDKAEIPGLSKAGFNITQIKEKTKKGRGRIKRIIEEAAADTQPSLWDKNGESASRGKGETV